MAADGQGRRVAVEVAGIVVFVIAFELAQQLKDSTSPLRLAFADLREQGRELLDLRHYRQVVEQEMYAEFNRIMEGELA